MGVIGVSDLSHRVLVEAMGATLCEAAMQVKEEVDCIRQRRKRRRACGRRAMGRTPSGHLVSCNSADQAQVVDGALCSRALQAVVSKTVRTLQKGRSLLGPRVSF
ncbi:hypothetical protein PYW08_006742 [Mythimna loreyi]|uniref:Uncharacterized protein n=1 Tax=Mythimna loreyi TaxID=667449 RepID=A0ACC2R9Z8_9NEOP|nr:hypothetical protein PYW08_006742 [Mythimna loreyi]